MAEPRRRPPRRVAPAPVDDQGPKVGSELGSDPPPPAETSPEKVSTTPVRETVEYEVIHRFEQWHIGERVWLFEDDPRTPGLVAIGMIRRC